MTTTSRIRVGALDHYEDGIRQRVLHALDGMDVEFASGTSESDRLAVASDVDVLLAGWSPVSADVIAASPRLRLVQKMGVGVDKIDLDAARARQVTVLRAAGINAGPVAEMTVLLMLALLRELPWAVSQLRAGHFQKEAIRSRAVPLAGQRVALVGFGNIGRAVATRLRGFDVEVRYFDVRADRPGDGDLASRMDLDELVAWGDIVSLHVPLLPDTHHLLDRRRIATMRPGAVVINTARGGLIDEDALCDALDEGRLRGAGLDVTAEEPAPTTSRLLATDKVIVTPHVGGAVASNFDNVAQRARHNILAVFAAEPVSEDDVVC